MALAVALPLPSISTVCSAIFLIVFAVVNAAACKAAAAIGARPWIAGLGSLGCAASLFALVVHSLAADPIGLAVLAALVTSALVVERLVLGRRRLSRSAEG